MFKKIIEKYCPEKTITLYKVFRTDDMNSGETLNVNTDREIFGLTDRAAMQNLLNSIGVDKIASEIVEGVMEDWIAGKEYALVTITMKKKAFVQAYEENSFDEEHELVACSLNGLDWEISITPIKLISIELKIDNNTHSINVTNLECEDIVK